jgi:hypothetical protein
LAEAQAETRAVFFVDAAHFVVGSFLGWLWCAARLCVRGASGRQRFNVLGAWNATTQELVRVTNHTYVTAETVCELLRKIAAMKLGVPITLVLDNAAANDVDFGTRAARGSGGCDGSACRPKAEAIS